MTKKIENEVMLNFVKHFYLDKGRLPKAKELNHRVVFFRRFHSIGKAIELLNLKVNFTPQTKLGYGKRIKLRLLDIEDLDFARFLGLVVADGSLRYDNYSGKYVIQIDFSLTEKELIEDTKNLCYKIFQKKPFQMIKEDKRRNPISRWVRLQYNSKELYFLIHKLIEYEPHKKSKTVRLKNMNFSNEWLAHFLGGLLDGDGCIEVDTRKRKENYYWSKFTTSSVPLKEQIIEILKRLGFEPAVMTSKAQNSIWFDIAVSRKSFVEFFAKNKSIKSKLFL